LKVALIGPYPVNTDKIAGGIAAVTYYLTQGMVKDPDLELHVISASKLVTEERTVKDDRLTVHYLAHRKNRLVPNLIRDIVRIQPFLRELAPDIVHSQTPSGIIAADREGLPAVITIHGIPEQEIQYARSLPERFGAMLQTQLARYALKRAKRCIAISPYVVNSFPKFRHLAWHHIHNPIEDRFFGLAGGEIPHKMLYAGVVNERKNLPGLVRAFALILAANPAAELFICGKVQEPAEMETVRQLVAEHDLSDKIHLLGFISQEELSRHFAEAAIICLFSREETAPMIIAQAMCAGKPVVARAAGGVPFLIRDGETGFVVAKGDEQAFADRSLQLLADAELRARFGRRGIELAEELFRADAVAAQTKQVYLQALDGVSPCE